MGILIHGPENGVVGIRIKNVKWELLARTIGLIAAMEVMSPASGLTVCPNAVVSGYEPASVSGPTELQAMDNGWSIQIADGMSTRALRGLIVDAMNSEQIGRNWIVEITGGGSVVEFRDPLTYPEPYSESFARMQVDYPTRLSD